MACSLEGIGILQNSYIYIWVYIKKMSGLLLAYDYSLLLWVKPVWVLPFSNLEASANAASSLSLNNTQALGTEPHRELDLAQLWKPALVAVLLARRARPRSHRVCLASDRAEGALLGTPGELLPGL